MANAVQPHWLDYNIHFKHCDLKLWFAVLYPKTQEANNQWKDNRMQWFYFILP